MSESPTGLDAREILAATIKALPVGYPPNHTPESIPERVADLVARYAETEREMAEAREALEKIEERYINGHDTYADHEFMGETAQQALARIDAKGGGHE